MFQSFPMQRFLQELHVPFLWPLLRQLRARKFVQLWRLKVLSTAKQWSRRKMWGVDKVEPDVTLRLFAVLALIRQLPGSSVLSLY